MKKNSLILLLCIFISNFLYSQSFSQPSFNAKVSVGVGSPTGKFSDTYEVFPGGQIELGYNLNSKLAVVGDFNFDLISPKVSELQVIGTRNILDSKQYTASLAARFYFLRNPKKVELYGDLGFGAYSFVPGDTVTGYEVPGNIAMEVSYTGYWQYGTNIGFGINTFLNSNFFFSANVHYHNIFERNEINRTGTVTDTYDNSVQTYSSTINAPNRNYFQLLLGIGYIFNF